MIKKLKIVLIVIIIVVDAGQILGQKQARLRELKVTGKFVHNATGTEFPETMEGYVRRGVYSFDKEKLNVGVTYEDKTIKSKTTFSVYLYPAGEGTEGRLRSEYISSLQSIAKSSEHGVKAIQGATYYKNEGYKINGFKAEIVDERSANQSLMSVFECGKWFFKIRITSESMDSLGINNLETRLLNYFSPTRLVKKYPLNPMATIYFAPAAFGDSLILGSAMGSAYKKVQWATDNVDSLERVSGFPDLYLELHVESLKEFLEFEKRQKWERQPSTTEYLEGLKNIINSGYLREFIMDQFDMIMIVPDNIKLDFEAYEKWIFLNPTKINLHHKFYVISYKE